MQKILDNVMPNWPPRDTLMPLTRKNMSPTRHSNATSIQFDYHFWTAFRACINKTHLLPASHDTARVVFIHHPGRPDTLRPIFIIREGKQWKIRRFGGSRDETRIAHGIAEARNLKDLPLSKDERAILENPRRYKEGKRTEMMAQCGIHEQ